VRTVLQSPIATLTAVCISMPAVGVSVANAASTDAPEGLASHRVATPAVELAAATSDLKLVLANVGSDPGVGAALANAGQTFEILALPKSLADNVVAANGTTSGLSGTVVDAGRQAAANILEAANQASLAADPTASLEDNIASRALQGLADIVFWLSNSNAFPGPLPTGFNPATYTSFFKVAQNLVNVAVLPFTVGNLLLTGQFNDISTTVSNVLNTLVTSLTQGLPTSIAQTVNWLSDGSDAWICAPLTGVAAGQSGDFGRGHAVAGGQSVGEGAAGHS
jgi:hypothetical protein